MDKPSGSVVADSYLSTLCSMEAKNDGSWPIR